MTTTAALTTAAADLAALTGIDPRDLAALAADFAAQARDARARERALADLTAATLARREGDAAWHDALRAAAARGVTLTAIGQAAGVTRQRVGQIIREQPRTCA